MVLLHSIIYPPRLSLKDQVCQRMLPSLLLLDLDDLPIHSVVQRPMVMVMVIMMDMDMVMGETKVDRQVEEVVY
jgi:hypothetical protein